MLSDLSCLLWANSTFGLFVFKNSQTATELNTSEDRKFCFWLLKKQNKINHLCWINQWFWVPRDCSLVLAPRWDKRGMFMWLYCLTRSLNLSQGLPKNNYYWAEKQRWERTKSTVYSTISTATYPSVRKRRWKHQWYPEGKMWMGIFPSKPPLPCAPPGRGAQQPAPLPSSSTLCCFVAKTKSEEQACVDWSDLCTLVMLVSANYSHKTV